MTTWILLRGLMREQRHWGDFPAQLAQALPGASIVTPDLPGNGKRHAMQSATSVAQMVAFLRADLLERGLAPPYSLLALSLGGMVAVEWASRHPGDIARCVLVNTSMRPYSSFYQRLRWQNYPAIVKLLLFGGVERQERLILRLTSNGSATQHGRLLQRWLDYQREFPVTRSNALRQLSAAARYCAPSERPSIPLLLVSSDTDRLVDHHCSTRLARAWQAEHHTHPTAGHDLPMDAGAWLAQTIAKWLAADKPA